MKICKQRFIIMSILVGLATCWLGLGVALADNPTSDTQKYYPVKEGYYWIYNLTSSLNPTTVAKIGFTVTEADENSFRVGVFDADSMLKMAEVVYQLTPQGITKTKQISQNGSVLFDPPQTLLSSNLAVGSSWSWTSTDQKRNETTKVISAEKVTVPAGTYDALVVQYTGIDESGKSYIDKVWWVKGVGYIKDMYSIDGKTETYELIETNSAK